MMGRAIFIGLLVLVLLGTALWLRRAHTPEQRLAALQDEVREREGIVFRAQLAGGPRDFLVLGCKVYLLDASAPGKVRREEVLRTGFYLGPLICTGQSIAQEGGQLLVELSNRAFGAGGGNTSGGSYRSNDGREWQKFVHGEWRPVAEAQK